jgi:hypothetical protein
MKSWYRQINAARSWQELLQAARDYIASLSPAEWVSLPEHCRPSRVKGIDDLAFWRDGLAEEYLKVAHAPDQNDVLREMLAFFTAAAERASEMCGTAVPQGEEAASEPGRPRHDGHEKGR